MMKFIKGIVFVALFFAVLVASSKEVFALCDVGTPVTASASDSSTTLNSGIKVFNSTQVGDDSAATRTAADALDDLWISETNAANLVGKSPAWHSGTLTGTITPPLTLLTKGTLTITAALQNMPGLATSGHDCDGVLNSTGQVLANSGAMQDNAPRPLQLYAAPCNSGADCSFWNDTGGSNSNRNAVLFEFTEPVKAFGAWFGDMETRTDGSGTAAIVRFLDASDNKIGEDVIIEPQPVVDQIGCGGDTPTASPSACGNEVTRWIGFLDTSATPRIRKMVVVVGDDDDANDGGTTDGNTEHLSFIGAKIAFEITSAGEVSLRGKVLSPYGRGMRNVEVVLTDDAGETFVTRTNAFGYFNFKQAVAGKTYVLETRSKLYQSNPLVVSANESLEDLVITLY